jgi:hypothetical protein
VISFQESLHWHYPTGVTTTTCFSTIYQKLIKLIRSFCCKRHFGLLLSPYLKVVFLKLSSAKGCQCFRETEMHDGGRALFAVLNLYARIKIRVATFNTNHSITDSTQTINHCFNPEASWFFSKVSQSARHKQSMYQTKQSGYQSVWGQPLTFLHVM